MKHFAVLVLVFMLIESCRKDEDTEAPTVVITSPVAGSSFDVLDVFTVSITVSDNEALSRVDVRLVTENLIQALPVSSHNATGTSRNLNVVYALDDVRMSSGSYFIEAIAYDAAGNEEHAYVQLNITAVPLRLLGVAAAYTSLNSVNVSEADTLWNVNVLGSYPGDFADLGVSSWWQQVAYTGKLSGPFRCWSLDGNYQGWTANAFPSSGDYWGKCESFEREWFINFRTDGVIRAKSWNGQNTTQYTANSGYFFNAFTCSGDYFYADQADATGTNRVLSVFDKTTGGGAVQQTNLNVVPVKMFPRDNNSIFIVANSSGQGRLLIYDFSANGTWEPVTLPSAQILSAAQVDSNSLLLAMNDGNIYKFTYNPVGVIAWASVAAQQVRYDPAGNTVVTAEGAAIRQYDYSSAALMNSVALPDSLEDIELRFNR